jgi:hypothetical protein
MRIRQLLKLLTLKERGKRIATGFNLLVILCILLTLSSVQNVGASTLVENSPRASVARAEGETVGTPWTGEKGIEETSAQIMARDRAMAATSPKAHPQKPYLRANRQNLKENPNALALAQFPAPTGPDKGPNARPYIPQTPSTEFTGATLTDTGAFPPDTMGTVGPSQFIVAVNGRIRSFNKTSGTADGVLNADPDVFFNSVMTPVGGSVVLNFTSDPRIRYDRLTNRWIIIIIDVPCTNASCTTTAANRVLLAVSDAASNGIITGATAWTFYFFQNDTVSPAGDTGDFFDYPTLGVDTNALYMGGNVFTSAGAFAGTTGFVIRKSSILSGGPIVVTAFRGLAVGAGAGPFTPQGVDNFDSTATEGYFIGTDNAVFSKLQIRRISNPGGTPSISGNLSITVPTTASPKTVPHQGNTGGTNGNLDALDERLFMAVIRNGSLWTAHNINVTSAGVGSSSGDRDGSRWYQIQNLTTTPSLAQAGTIFDSAASNPLFYWIPSIMVSGQGHVAMGFSAAGNASFASAATVGRLSGDASGTMQVPPVIYEAGIAAYNPPSDPGGSSGRRWGDYSYTSLDPEDDMTMWTIQEFTSALNSYGVRAVKLLAPPPATPASAPNVATGQSSVNVSVTGTSASGSGFYDPGAGFAKRITASVSGGVVVNSVTYVDPTHVTLNISTVSVPAGAKNVTITNPDGQSLTGTGILTVTGPCSIPVTSSVDDGTAGTFRSAVAAANASANCKIVDLTSLNPGTTITLNQTQGGGVTVGTGVTLLGPACGVNGPTLTISGAGTPAATGDGLTLNGGNNISGLWIRAFGGRQIVTAGPGNGLSCVKATKA